MSIERVENIRRDRGECAAFGAFQLFPSERLLEREGAPVDVGGHAMDVLIALVTQAGRVVSKADLLASVWPDTTVVDGALRVHVSNLRKALGDGVNDARYITSVAGRGYCFVAPVIWRPALRHRESVSSGTARGTAKLAHRLPPTLARMAGRDETSRTLTAQVLGQRFVTILGAAGIGKTTVAVSVAHALLDDFEGAVHFVELGSLTDPALVATTVASTLGVQLHAGDALSSLQAALQDQRLLLVLDNCEHVVGEAARLAERLFLHTPRVHLLTTSREALRVEGERIHRLGPLRTPAEGEAMSAEIVQTFPAVQVFLERAAANGWAGDLSDDDVPVVSSICRRLDGVPLSLELAAGSVSEFGLRGTATLLDDRLLRWHGRRTAPPRQRTLHAVVAWSYDRLLARERVVLRRLSVLLGSFRGDAAAAVVLEAGDSVESLFEVLAGLVAKSLVALTVEGGAVAYRMLETTRFYALARLTESGELEQVSLRHASFFAACLENESDAREPAALSKRPSLLANVRAALDWGLASPAGNAAGAKLAGAAARTLLASGLVSECHTRCRRALEVLGETDRDTLVEFRLQEGFALSAMWGGNNDGMRPAFDRALEVARALGGGDHEVRLLENLNFLLQRTGELREALEVAEESLAAARAGSTAAKITAEWMVARSHYMCGNQVLALEHCEAGMRLAANSGESPATFLGHTPAVLCLARVLWLRGQADRALAQAREIVRKGLALNHPVYQCIRLLHCELIVAWHGEWDEAGHLLDTLRELSERYSLGSYRAASVLLRGKLLVATGRPEEGCALLRTAAATLKTARVAALDNFLACGLAEGLLAVGLLEEALVTIDAAIEHDQRQGGTWELPELLRVKGVLLATQPGADFGAADASFLSAIELAQRQGALAWELRATTCRARETLKRGSASKVLDDLGALYAKFTEGFGTPDLRAARNLLEQRASR